ncbi:hypothetical protein [Streptomyces sp. M2CJ-2]|uniref:hypothetical protein n=1 Tax=Streptomyces sp. M2CJ-2 TaxID=2803948 RepID=UPI001F161BB3|nr:hypothetical protein [Streptomyces sp. M2CJ-2]
MTERTHRATARTEAHGEEEKTPARPALRVVHEPEAIDLAATEAAAGQFLSALGISTASESLRRTPGRMARAYAELFSPRPFDLTTFPTARATTNSFWPAASCGGSESRRRRSDRISVLGDDAAEDAGTQESAAFGVVHGVGLLVGAGRKLVEGPAGAAFVSP